MADLERCSRFPATKARKFTIQQLQTLQGDHREKSFATEIRTCGRVLPSSVWSYSHG